MSSSTERNNPPPRRKSCDACRAAKRRCDLAFPACFRCSRRGIPCVYPGLPAPDQIPELLALLKEREQPMPIPVPGQSLEPARACAEQLDFASAFPFDPAPVLDLPEVELETPVRSLSSETERSYYPPLTVLNDLHEMMHVRSSVPISLPALLESRFRYAIDTLKDTPRMMIAENKTPWSHAQLYVNGMPKVMQDAYACCALYITKTPINAPVITSNIHSRLQELTLSPLPTSPLDLLAHTHALLLYTIMHLFDADLAAANTSSALDTLSMAALESAASLLFSSTHFPPADQSDSPSPSSSDSNPNPNSNLNPCLPTTLSGTMHFWPLWIHEESARRTILFTFYFLQIIRLFRGEENLKCDGKLGLLHSWYSSAYLWNASSAMDFAVAWSEREHFIVRNVNFQGVLERAKPEDVDVFGRMLLVTSQGVESVREWFWGRGSIL
ncbi:Zn(II)2Cys6 transcription factor domain-containing protein [Aspergillus undulatus]|uniref:Zn(II)2Cys6 transcription factor domain-containing protein n=1 Tax=Aspergillus undulatus TaxID=1810928 RepID=UPI003CCDEFAE